jgi:hypothetical protein
MTGKLEKEAAPLLGRTIVGVELNTFDDGRGGVTSDPILRFDDGSALALVVEETEVAEYGIKLRVRKKVVAAPRRPREAKTEERT